MTISPVAWVVGSGGLLGSAVVRQLATQGVKVHVATISWSDVDQAIEDFSGAIADFSALAGSNPWHIYWCAGASTTTSTRAELDREVSVLQGALAKIGEAHVTSPSNRIGLFLASSAGAVYSGAPNPPFTEFTAAQPLSEYGRAKLDAEKACRDFSAANQADLFVGRIANLYGPGQNLSKGQGLVTTLVKAVLTDEPVRLYVPMETKRDFIYSRDCAEMAVHGLSQIVEMSSSGGQIVTKILASGQALTLKDLIFRVESVLGAAVPLQHVSSPASAGQSPDLTFESKVMTELSSTVVTSLDEGITSVNDSIKDLLGRE